jgi:hypothetical protein
MYVNLGSFQSPLKKRRKTKLKIQVFIPVFIAAMFVVGFSDPNKNSVPSTIELLRQNQPPRPAPVDKKQLSNNPWAYFHPTWMKSTPWTLIAVSEDLDHSIEYSKAELLVEDPQNRIEKEFIPTGDIRGRVQFWIDIYSRFSSRTRVIHDRRHPEVMFGYMDFRPLYRNMSSKVAAEIKASAFEKKILKELKLRLDEAAGLSKTHFLSLDEKTAIQAFLSRSGALDKTSYLKLIKNIRTQTGQSDIFLMALQRSKYLLPHIESVFKQQGLPIALARIPFVESSFNSKALSKIGAVGIWQFTPETARELIHSDAEHLWADPLRQTKSAAKLLKLYRAALPDWGTTITSYNTGVGRVRRIVEKYNVTNVGTLIELSHTDTLGFAGKNFYSEFLAANFVEAYKEELFGSLLNGIDSMLVFKKNGAIPKELCDL